MKHQKVAVIVWTVDPERERRFLLRHNKPFNGYEDEWTVAFGTVEDPETNIETAKREVLEEYGISEIEEIKDLNYFVEFQGKNELTQAHFFAIKVKNLDIKIILNEESIGYDWIKIEDVLKVMKYEDEKKAFEFINK